MAAGQELRTVRIYHGNYYDWCQLKRWGIDVDRLLPGSEVLFRVPSLFEEFRWQIITTPGEIRLPDDGDHRDRA